MKTLVFLNDIHLNFIDDAMWKMPVLCNDIKSNNPDYLVIAGDISEALTLQYHLMWLEKELLNIGVDIPIFFVLGNHDYYHGSISAIRELISKTYCPGKKGNCRWLGCSGIVPLIPGKVALVGHDGWYDGGYANWFNPSVVQMSDYDLILELKRLQCPNNQLRFDKLNELSQESADYVKLQLEAAYNQGYRKAFVATHVAPFPELSVFNGKISNQCWMPCFSSKRMGGALLEVARQYPDFKIITLSGHTHGEAYCAHYAPNLEGYAGYSDYGIPGISKIFKLEE